MENKISSWEIFETNLKKILFRKDFASKKSFFSNNIGSFFWLSCAAFLLLLIYAKHFDNPFEFDDDHTIKTNEHIKDLKNIPLFFKDGTTTSSLPSNQAYRPGLTGLNAIDYWFGGKAEPEPFYFHRTIFITYIILGFILFFFFLKIFNQAYYHKWNILIALYTTTWFWVHTANAETINYIIARSDSFSTLMIVLSFILFIFKPAWNRYYVYLIPVIIGFFVKEPTIMFGLLLFLYLFLFKENLSLSDIFRKKHFSKLTITIWQIAPAIIVGILLFLWSRYKTPATWESGYSDWYHYAITQPFVIVHYINNFIFPVNLVIDTDWSPLQTIFDDRFIAGVIIIFFLLFIALKTSNNIKTKPITFGILWFFIALIPTSSIFPFSEVLNDHRTFFPYIGLFIASSWAIGLLIYKYEQKIIVSPLYKKIIFSIAIIILCAHTIGTLKRIEVWDSSEKLWKEATEKSPLNGRAWMNYGLTQMAKANWVEAEKCFKKTNELWPLYPLGYINMGILNASINKPIEAEEYYRKGLSFGSSNPSLYYFYGRFLVNQKRFDEAKIIVDNGLHLTSNHTGLLGLKEEIINNSLSKEELINNLVKVANQNPTAENYINLSLEYYNQQKYEDCIKAAREAIKIKPDYALAYNNICAAHNLLHNWDKAIEACNEAIKIQPDFQLAKNNLNEALKQKNNK